MFQQLKNHDLKKAEQRQKQTIRETGQILESHQSKFKDAISKTKRYEALRIEHDQNQAEMDILVEQLGSILLDWTKATSDLKRSLEKIDKRRQGGLDRLMLEGSELFAGESHILEKTLPEL